LDLVGPLGEAVETTGVPAGVGGPAYAGESVGGGGRERGGSFVSVAVVYDGESLAWSYEQCCYCRLPHFVVVELCCGCVEFIVIYRGGSWING
jgi:hypothetical protein